MTTADPTPRKHISVLIVFLSSILMTAFLAKSTFAGTFTVFGQESYQRQKGRPVTVRNHFEVLNPDAEYVIKIYNGGLNDEYRRVSSARIWVNGTQVVRPRAFKPWMKTIEKPVSLTHSNQIAVRLQGKPGSGMVVEVYGLDDELPIITATVDPDPNENGWHNTDVTVSFTCEDTVSGIASCPEPVTLTTESGSHTVGGSAADKAGNTADTTVTVRLDKTPPAIARNWPPVDDFVTDRHRIDVEGRFTDALSGIDKGVIRDHSGEAVLAVPDFAVARDLRTDIPTGSVTAENLLELRAVDAAGNMAQAPFIVQYTEGTHLMPSPSQDAEPVAGLLTSVNIGTVFFADSVGREEIDVIGNEYGGRVVGFIPSLNMAQILFETPHAVDLIDVLDALNQQPEVVAVAPEVFSKVDTFDNELLSPEESAAYDSIKLIQGAEAIRHHYLANIAIIDTGLNPYFGKDNEFADIEFYNMCTPRGQQGSQGSPGDNATGHGTKITGVVAGANNGSGNNGVVQGIPGSRFNVKVFKAACDDEPHVEWSKEVAALALLTEGVNGTVIDADVVNMSYSKTIEDDRTTDKDDFLAWFFKNAYETVFRSEKGRNMTWVASGGQMNTELKCTLPIWSDPPVDTVWPAWLGCSEENVISVGGYDPATLGISGTSNYGEAISIYAPGAGVYSAVEPNLYGPVNGTSAATALVSGATALLISDTQLSPAKVKWFMGLTAQPLNAVIPQLPQGGLDVEALIIAAGFQSVPERFKDHSDGGLETIELMPSFEISALSGFLFDFDENDHHVKWMKTGLFEESHNPMLMVHYADKNGDDGYSWEMNLQSLPPGTTVHEFPTGNQIGSGSGDVDIDLPYNEGIPVLVGFGLSVEGGDHHVQKIEILLTKASQTNGPGLHIDFRDDGEFDYGYKIRYAFVPRERVINANGFESGYDDRGSTTEEIDAESPLLTGFKMEFSNGDHHLDQAGVRLMPGSPGNVTVWFNDKNDDDPFDWNVHWIDVR